MSTIIIVSCRIAMADTGNCL